MALSLADRVQETTSTSGTGTLTLSGAVPGFRSFSVIGNGNTTYYTIISSNDWEVGIGTYTSSGTTLSRDTVLSSSAGGSKITVSPGSLVFCDYPASKAVYLDDTGKPNFTFDILSPITTKGDLITSNGSADVRLGVGADNLYLAADSTSPTGLSWKSVLTPAVSYTASSLSLTNGVYVSGSVTDTQVLNDGNAYQITDGTAAGPAWIVTFTINGVASFNRVVANIDYTLASGHTVYFQLYNTTTSTWDNIGSYSGASGYSQYALEVLGYTSYISSGTVQARLYHSNTGNAAHATKIDYFALEQSNQGSQGPRGATGATGASGQGVATGGTAGQVLVKNSATNYDTAWSGDLSLTTLNTTGKITSQGGPVPVLGQSFLTSAGWNLQ